MRIPSCVLAGVAVVWIASSTGCALKDTMNVQAEAGRPSSSLVEQVVIPLDSSKPQYVLLVEQVTPSQNSAVITFNQASAVPVGDQMAAQLTTALSKVGNFVLYDARHAGKIHLKKGQKGPYLLRATLTEFNEVAEADAQSSGVSLGTVGAVVGIAGAIVGKPGLIWTGAGVAAANPSYQTTTATRKGMVALDVQIVEKGSGRIVNSFEAAGSFKAQSESNGISLFGISNAKAKFASSAVGQALRVAMNDAVSKTVDALR